MPLKKRMKKDTDMDAISKTKAKSLFRSSRTNLLFAVVIGVAVIASGYIVLRSGAAGFFAFSEPEQVTLSGNAHIVSDGTASGGKALKFGNGTTTPPPTPIPPPTPTPTPMPPPTPPPSGGTGSGCLSKPSSCGYPDATNTGVPAGVSLKASGSITVTAAGTVISGLDINGTVTIKAANVVIKNCRITIPGSPNRGIAIESGNVTIEDTDIIASTPSVVIGYGSFTLRRVDMSGGVDALRADGNVGVYDSYIHDLQRRPESHDDILQTINGSDITVKHNTLYAFKGTPGSGPDGGDPMNAGYQFGNFTGPGGNILVENNLINGGNYTISYNPTSGKANAGSIRILNNKFGRDHRYGVFHGNVLAHMVVKGNRYVDNNQAIGPQ